MKQFFLSDSVWKFSRVVLSAGSGKSAANLALEPEMHLPSRHNLSEHCWMKFSVSLVLLCSVPALCHAHPAHHHSRPAPDPMYSSALAAANRFLHAWQSQDHEAGIMMLADSGRLNASPESLQAFFSPGPDAAYEIAHGQRLKAGEYVFPLALLGSSSDPHPRFCKLIVLRA